MNEKYFTSKGILIISTSLFFISFFNNIFLINKIAFQYRVVYAISIFLLFIFIILLFYGLGKILKGKNEFNPEHKENVDFGKTLVISSILISIFIKNFVVNLFLDNLFIEIIIDSAVGVLFLIGLIYLVKELIEKNYEKILYLGVFLNIIFNLPLQLIFDVEDNLSVFHTNYTLSLIGISFIPTLLFVYVYYKTYQKIRKIDPLDNKN